MKTKFLIPFLLTGILYAGCGSGENQGTTRRSSADTSSSQVATPSSDSIIKDSSMKDITNKTDNPTPASKTNSSDKNGSGNP